MSRSSVISSYGRIAVLSPSPTHPQNFGNRKRIYSFCKELRIRGYKVSFLFYPFDHDWRDTYSPHILEQMRKEWDEVELIIPSRPYHPAAIGEDHMIDEWWDDAIGTYLSWFFRTRKVEAFITNYTYLSKALEFAPDTCLKVLDTHDKFAHRRQVLGQLHIGPEFFHTTIEEEAKALDRADLVLALKDEEKAYFESISDTPAITLPYFEKGLLQPTSKPKAQRESMSVGIIGARNNINYQNVSGFLNAFLPAVRAQMAPVKVVLAGGMCADFQDYQNNPYVDIIGRVDTVDTFYKQVDLVAIPMQISTGQKIKVGEALSQKKPIVGMQHAFEGYETNSAFHKFKSFEALAQQIIDLSFSDDLDAVEQATISVQQAQEAYSIAAFDILEKRINSQRARILFYLDINAIGHSPIAEANALSAVLKVSKLYEPTIILDGDLRALSEKFLQCLSQEAILYAAEGSTIPAPANALVNALGNSYLFFKKFNFTNAWIFGDKGIGFAADAGLKTFASPRYARHGIVRSIQTSSSANNRTPVYFGTPDKASSILTDAHIYDLSAFTPEAIKALGMNLNIPKIDHAAIIVDAHTKHWLPAVSELIRSSTFEYRVLCTKADHKDVMSTLADPRISRYVNTFETYFSDGAKTGHLTFRKILNFSAGSETGLFAEFLACLKNTAYAKAAVWKFPASQTYKPLDILPDIYDYLYDRGDWRDLEKDAPFADTGDDYLYRKLRMSTL